MVLKLISVDYSLASHAHLRLTVCTQASIYEVYQECEESVHISWIDGFLLVCYTFFLYFCV